MAVHAFPSFHDADCPDFLTSDAPLPTGGGNRTCSQAWDNVDRRDSEKFPI